MLLIFSCTKLDSKRSFSEKIAEVKRLRALERNIEASDSTLIYIEQIQKIIDSDKNLPDSLYIENVFRKGVYHYKKQALDSASYYYHKTVDLVKGPNTRDRNLIYFWNTWILDRSQDRLANVIDVAKKFVKISDEKKHAYGLTIAYNFLEVSYFVLGNYEQAWYYNKKGLEAAKASNNMDMYVVAGNSKARMLYNHFNKKQEAFAFLDSLQVVKTTKKDTRRQYLRQYGTLSFADKNYKKAIKYYDSVIALTKEIESGKNYNLLEGYNNLAESYIELKEYELAERYLDTVSTIIDENSFTEYVSFYNELRFRVNYGKGNSEESLLEEYKALIDRQNKLHEEKIDEELESLKRANEQEKITTAEKNASEQRNIIFISLSVLLGLLVIIVYLFYRQRRLKFQKQDLQMQQRLLRSQMNPHFTFNILSVIQHQVKENQEKAVNYLLKFSRLLRLILENSLHNYVQIEDELESLRKYLELQLIRFPKKFDYTITLENFEEDEFLFIPPMLMQPFIENSIEHGFLGIDYKGNIDIKLRLEDKFIACTIEDNGIGIKETNNTYKKSVSTKLISKFINKTTKSNVQIQNKTNTDASNSGVLVKFLIPYKFSQDD
ncbi:histidine kinase [uncultured Kordia sp.]|uniref:histidine kinase n=1 Tax=uncultured Kordia sp. TaxID=507699 RepID=UPI002625A642|nr:histidine kinase [uncultured Kordia sp.]